MKRSITSNLSLSERVSRLENKVGVIKESSNGTLIAYGVGRNDTSEIERVLTKHNVQFSWDNFEKGFIIKIPNNKRSIQYKNYISTLLEDNGVGNFEVVIDTYVDFED